MHSLKDLYDCNSYWHILHAFRCMSSKNRLEHFIITANKVNIIFIVQLLYFGPFYIMLNGSNPFCELTIGK